MIVYIIAAIVCIISAWFLFYWTTYGVEQKYPEQFLKQMVAGCWFLIGMAIILMVAAPIINIIEKREIPVLIQDEEEIVNEIPQPE